MKLIDRLVDDSLKSWFWRYHSIWLFVLVAGLFSEFATRQWDWPPQTILMIVALSLSMILGGIRNALAAATIITFYVFYHRESFDEVRVALLIVGAYSIALGGGYLKVRDRRHIRMIERLRVIDEINQQKINFVDGLNGNIEASKVINEMLIDLIKKLPYLTKDETINQLMVAQDIAADLAQRTLGWNDLYLQKKSVIEGDKKE